MRERRRGKKWRERSSAQFQFATVTTTTSTTTSNLRNDSGGGDTVSSGARTLKHGHATEILLLMLLLMLLLLLPPSQPQIKKMSIGTIQSGSGVDDTETVTATETVVLKLLLDQQPQ